jgi:hypothetical protein
MTQQNPSLSERFLSQLNESNFSQAAHLLRTMDSRKAVAAIPLVLDYLRAHAGDLKTRSQVHLPSSSRVAHTPELDDLHPNQIDASVWKSMLTQLAGSGIRYNEEKSVKPALDVLKLSVRTRRDDVLSKVLSVVHKIRRGEHYAHALLQKAGVHPTALNLLEVLNHLDAHKGKLPEEQQPHIASYVEHVKKEIFTRAVKPYRL